MRNSTDTVVPAILQAHAQASVQIPNRFVVAEPEEIDASASAFTNGPDRKWRVLLVEDNDGVRIATETFLRFEGHETLSAPSVAEAEKLFAALRPSDIVIADYHLDSQNTGLDLLLRLRNRVGQDVPGIVLSGDLPAVLRAVKSPVINCKFLSKPVDTTALVDAIAELTGSRDQDRGAA